MVLKAHALVLQMDAKYRLFRRGQTVIDLVSQALPYTFVKSKLADRGQTGLCTRELVTGEAASCVVSEARAQ